MHPLDPLSAGEITAASQAVKDFVAVDKQHQLRFVAVSLKEPARADHPATSRQAEVVTLDPSTGLASEFDVNLGAGEKATVISSKKLPLGTQPMLTPDDCDLAEEIAKNSPELQAALEERYGITDMDKVCCDPWSVHFACDEDKKMAAWRDDGVPGRLVQTFLYQRMYGDGMEDNHVRKTNQSALGRLTK